MLPKYTKCDRKLLNLNKEINHWRFTLKKLWEELGHYTTYRLSYTKDATASKKHIEEIQMFEFQASLNSEYERVRVEILNMNLSSLNEVYVHIHREDGRRGVMNVLSAIEKSTFISTSSRGGCGGPTHGHGWRFNTYDFRDHLKYEHCGKSRHTKDQCWDLYRRP